MSEGNNSVRWFPGGQSNNGLFWVTRLFPRLAHLIGKLTGLFWQTRVFMWMAHQLIPGKLTRLF